MTGCEFERERNQEHGIRKIRIVQRLDGQVFGEPREYFHEVESRGSLRVIVCSGPQSRPAADKDASGTKTGVGDAQLV